MVVQILQLNGHVDILARPTSVASLIYSVLFLQWSVLQQMLISSDHINVASTMSHVSIQPDHTADP